MSNPVNIPQISALHHVAILAPDLEAALEFYGVILGLSPLLLPDEVKGCVLWFDLGHGQQLHVVNGRPSPDGRAHFAFNVTQVDQWRAHLVKHRVGFYEAEVQIKGKERIFATDPWGNLIEFTQVPAQR